MRYKALSQVQTKEILKWITGKVLARVFFKKKHLSLSPCISALPGPSRRPLAAQMDEIGPT